ncbi:hypothetical protein SUGI_0651270 [Cryptomeria japonica]|nr:hypothetical protein SUGI_0651270 [Cryptomeria japonica]
MTTKLFSLHRSLFLKTPSHFRFNFSNLAENNVSNSNAPSQNLFLHFVTTRFNMSSADTVKFLKKEPSLERLKTLDKVEQLTDNAQQTRLRPRSNCKHYQISSLANDDKCVKIVGAKIQLLKDLGVQRENIPKIVTKSPRILTYKLETLRSNLEFFKTLFPNNDFVVLD